MKRAPLLPVVLLSLTACVAVAEDAPLGAGNHELTLSHGGRERYYLVHVPKKVTTPAPLVLAFHGGGGNAEGMIPMCGLDALADREGFVVAYPGGTGPLRRRRLLTWNAGWCCGSAQKQNVDDVGFSVALLEDLARRVDVDPTRVYATGFSNGAMMAYRLALEIPERLAAVVPVGGAMGVEKPGAPTRPVPILHIHSVDDPRALYQGGLGPPFPLTRKRNMHAKVERVIEWWRVHNGCAEEPRVDPKTEGAAGTVGAGHTAQRFVWGSGKEGSEVTLLKLTGAGHTWPGSAGGYFPERLIGAPTTVVDASEELWAFCKRFRRADAPPLRRAKPSRVQAEDR